MAVSLISMNSVSFSNYDSASGGGGSSGLLDFSTGSSGGDTGAPASVDSSAMAPMDTSSMAPMDTGSMASMDTSSVGMYPTDPFQSSGPMADFTPPPQAAASPAGGFDFVA